MSNQQIAALGFLSFIAISVISTAIFLLNLLINKIIVSDRSVALVKSTEIQ